MTWQGILVPTGDGKPECGEQDNGEAYGRWLYEEFTLENHESVMLGEDTPCGVRRLI